MHDTDPKVPSEKASSSETGVASEDYVWDVFYHRPLTLSEWNEASNVATLYVPLGVVGHLVHTIVDRGCLHH